MNHTSHSEIQLKRKCSRAHHYRYSRRLKRRRPFREPLIGIILHEMIDAFVHARMGEPSPGPWEVFDKHKAQHDDLFREEKEKYGDVPTIVTAIFEGYLRRWRGDGLKYEASEIEVETELERGLKMRCKIDKVVVDTKSGLRFLMDHKFHAQIPDAEDRFADIQTLLYFWIWNREHGKGEQADGILWDYGRMKAPATPEVLKSGELTKRANIDTDAHTYLQTIRTNGLNPRDYVDILRSLEGKERTFFERVPLPAPPKSLVAEVVNDVKITAAEIRAGKHAARDGMSQFTCRRCEFRSLCEAELRGHDTKLLLKRDYMNRDEEAKK